MRGRSGGLGVVVGTLLLGTLVGAPEVRAQASAAPPGTVEVPLTVGPAGRLIVPVETADGRPLRFALHTAMPSSRIAASAAGDDVDALRLRIAGLDTPLTGVEPIADGALARGGHSVDGFLLLSSLGDIDVLLDVPAGRMVLRPVGRAVEWAGVDLARPTPLRIYHGVAMRIEVELDGRPYGATFDLANPGHTVTAGVWGPSGAEPPSGARPAEVTIGGATHTLSVVTESTSLLRRWDPDASGFVAFGADLAAECAISISYVHQELRTCVR